MEWFRFYDEVLDDPKVQRLPAATFRDWVNILCLVSRNEPRGIVPAVSDVAFGLRVSEKKAAAIIEELTKAGLLATVAGVTSPHGWDKRQRVSDSSAERVAKHRANKEASNATGNVTPPVTRNDSCNKRETLPHARATDTDTDTDTDTEEKTPKSPKPKIEDDPRFVEFWSAYPIKVSKQAAVKAFGKLNWLKVDFDSVMAALERQKVSDQWTREGGKYIPYPATWLNGAKWEDELKPATSANSSIAEPKGYSHDPDEARQQMHRDLETLQRQATSGGNVTAIRGRIA